MIISGIQKNSFVDFPGKVSAVVFTPGCNMNCFYCLNRMLISSENNEGMMETDSFLNMLSNRKGFLDGVVVSGGEPTLQNDLGDFIKRVKNLGYPVKLDTNGSNPEAIESLIDKGLVDYIAMDIKAPLDRYSEICGRDVDIERIKRSIDILKRGTVAYEFRTTVAPGLNMDDIFKIARSIAGARLYVLQKCREIKGADMRISYSPQFLLDAAVKIKGIVNRVETRGVAVSA